jgi:hypothetical protein
MLTRSFGNNFSVDDWTEEVNIIPNQWGTIGSLGLFEEIPVAEHVVVFEKTERDGAVIVDRPRGERAQVGADDTRTIHTFSIPHFPYDDAISPSDIQGRRAYGSQDSAETLTAVRLRKMDRIRQNHAWTLEKARAQLLTAGTVYAPNGTVSQNWFAEFGVTQTEIDFDLDTNTTDVIAKSEEVVAAIQDNAGNGGMLTGIVALCGTTFFSRLINHANIKAVYQAYASASQDIYRDNRVGTTVAGMHREFTYQGIRYIEMRDAYNGTRLITATDCVFVPTGTDAFKTYFSPAHKFDFVNTLGEQVYMFEYQSQRGDKIEIETESNFVNACMRPAVIVRGYTG